MSGTIINAELCKKAEKALIKLKTRGTTANKLKAIIASYHHNIKKVSEVFGCDRSSIYIWAKQLKEGGEDKLINKAKLKDGILLKNQHKEQIKKWIIKNPNTSIMEIKEMLENRYDIKASKSTVHRAMKSVGFSYITARQKHYKQNQEEVEDFKKNFTKK